MLWMMWMLFRCQAVVEILLLLGRSPIETTQGDRRGVFVGRVEVDRYRVPSCRIRRSNHLASRFDIEYRSSTSECLIESSWRMQVSSPALFSAASMLALLLLSLVQSSAAAAFGGSPCRIQRFRSQQLRFASSSSPPPRPYSTRLLLIAASQVHRPPTSATKQQQHYVTNQMQQTTATSIAMSESENNKQLCNTNLDDRSHHTTKNGGAGIRITR